ncbi:serotransferrin-like isoform X2 [Corythoichthys intestinalis]|uniref:serotransferrin-like isoform X2 n=1 Tax=Corythoichthys intestinalis TaxID=161448 RepID=UPI0025A6487E|nr:serotransferrin-like isoform X2 [Corythoichthys intestinalis]
MKQFLLSPLLHALLLPTCLADVSSAPSENVRWCVISWPEHRKCQALAAKAPMFSCVKRASPVDCIQAIHAGEADAVTLDAADIYLAGLENYKLKPIIAEEYGPASNTCNYAVAVSKRGSVFGIRDVAGKRSCHSGKGAAGWYAPITTLIELGILRYDADEDQNMEAVVGRFFSSSCIPGAQSHQLCKSCKGDCSRSHHEDFYDCRGAFRCLVEGSGDVAFFSHLSLPEHEQANYELLCKDNTRSPITDYQRCHLSKVPAHAVVTRQDLHLAELIWQSLDTVRGFNLFSSEGYTPTSKNLMFRDSTVKLVQLPANIDSYVYLGAKFLSIVRSLNRGNNKHDHQANAWSYFASLFSVVRPKAIRWCAVGKHEIRKCDEWSIHSMLTGEQHIECNEASSVEECLRMILSNEADAVTVDAGEMYTAGQCGLVPAMVEQYDEVKCGIIGATASSYYAVAVVRKDSGITWANLRGKKSCHTGYGRTAGWNIPMAIIHKEINDCDFTKFFSSGCAPGAPISSSFCSQCEGSSRVLDDIDKCRPNKEEKYYGYGGAFRCLVENAGDVAFIKHTTVEENSDGKGPQWSMHVFSNEYELICPRQSHPVPITEFESCHLGVSPAKAVMTRPEIHQDVVSILQEQQAKFGRGGSDRTFSLFQSRPHNDLLFKDSTKCLQEIPIGTDYKVFLGAEYMATMASLRECSTPDLEKLCHSQPCLENL